MAPQTERFSLLPDTDFGTALDSQIRKQSQLSPQDIQQLNQKRSDAGNKTGNTAVDNLPTVSVQSQTDSASPTATSAPRPEAPVRPPTGTATMPSDYKPADSNKQHSWTSFGIDAALGVAAVLAIDAIGTVAFKNPKAGFMAGEAFAKYAGLTEAVGTVALRTGLTASTMASAGVLRHYSYQFLTGDKESWQDSTHHVASTVGTFMLAKRAARFLDRSPAAALEPLPTPTPAFKPIAS